MRLSDSVQNDKSARLGLEKVGRPDLAFKLIRDPAAAHLKIGSMLSFGVLPLE